MESDEFNISTPVFSLGMKKSEFILKIEEGKVYIIRSWSWRKFGFIKKLIKYENGVLTVNVIK